MKWELFLAVRQKSQIRSSSQVSYILVGKWQQLVAKKKKRFQIVISPMKERKQCGRESGQILVRQSEDSKRK